MGIVINNPSASATPSGANTQVQFNDGGVFGGDSGLTYNKTTDSLSVGSVVFGNTSFSPTFINLPNGFSGTPRITVGNTYISFPAGESVSVPVIGFGASPNSSDLFLSRDDANIFALRNGASSQTQRLYKSITDFSNYTRSAWNFDANGVQLIAESAGTGDANIDITFTPKGTGRLRYGTHSAVAAEVITGYIEIKDSTGTLRKLAVIS